MARRPSQMLRGVQNLLGLTRLPTGLLLPKQANTLSNYYILPDFRGKPGVGAGVPDINAALCREKLTPKHTPAFSTHPGGSTGDGSQPDLLSPFSLLLRVYSMKR
jgi:hypothetical protein